MLKSMNWEYRLCPFPRACTENERYLKPFRQAEACAYHLPPGGIFDRDLQWGVPASAKISTPSGRQPVHDDRLLSASLVAVFDDLYTTGQLRLGRAHSAIIPATDPLDNLSF